MRFYPRVPTRRVGGRKSVIRHYDVTEKLCPLYYVEHEDAWIQMKADIQGVCGFTFLRAVLRK